MCPTKTFEPHATARRPSPDATAAAAASKRPTGLDLGRGIWRVADPKITLASVASMILGVTLAAHDGAIASGWLVMTALGVFCVEAAKNASGELVDWSSGADLGLRDDERTPFSGGKRVLVDGLMTPMQTAIVAASFYLLAAAFGFAIVVVREPRVMWLGLAGMALAFFYHAPPLKLSYRGLGELAVAIAYGPVIACGTYLVQRHDVAADIVWASVPLGLAIMAFLWINELPDARADEAAGKRTLVVRLGRRRAARAFAVIVALVWLGVALLPLAGLPLGAWAGFVGLPTSARAARHLLAFPESPSRMVPAQAWTLVSFVLLAVGMGAGVLMWP